ncbi:hypothetical protein SPRG_20860 [Saprolegnia parasitica CBS 223.65]|uniref:Uncharacterized protein n=1 Tax=Saprolegnia parasitica (strain CBS 223.65) TaxID=695850 RepID=A0A067C5N0_SAPPC|nr:hypothetical protein SPRG_20860 [Saprolegnia parasitica CBS 223.65]KDO24455.1 hypothetical protein SPRG_20860 [Saprolegnia parasitica CBS 223.65]|eukprot:XP_012204891.1 hypothetical protein SPRG_20860 [Saprolegnia parasitica CBS 223.65]
MVKVPVADAATTAPVSGATDDAAAKTARGLVVDAALMRAVLLKAAELGFVQELPTIIQAPPTGATI